MNALAHNRMRKMHYRIKYLAIIIFVVAPAFVRSDQMGRYDIEVFKLEHCEEGEVSSKQIMFESSRISKRGKDKYVYSTKMIMTSPISDEHTLKINLHIYGNGGYKPNFLVLEFDKFCSTSLFYVPTFFNALMKAANVTSCPMPAGVYDVVDIPVSVGRLNNVPNMIYGKYKMLTYVLTPEGDQIGCMAYFFDIVPKKSSKKKNG